MISGVKRDLVLRSYQRESLDEVLARFADGRRRQMLCAPTGAGKTVIAAEMLRSTRSRGKRGLMVADRIALVDQTSRALREYGVPHGVLQGDRIEGRGATILVCSAQTLERRRFWPACDLLIVDEAHAVRKGTSDFMQQMRGYVVGLSATPFTKGLGRLYDGVVNVVSTNELIEEGWLAPPRIFVGVEIDMRGADTNSRGEWRDRDIEQRGMSIIGDIVSTWVEKTHEAFGGPVKTLVFTATTAYGAELCERFQRAGYDFRQSTYRDSAQETQSIVGAFRNGEFTGLVSVDKFTKGFDDPSVKCLIMARPFRKSFAAYIQQLGRGLRPFPNKDYCLVLDHAGNAHGFARQTAQFFDAGVERLDLGQKKRVQVRDEGAERPNVVCTGCGFVLEPDSDSCPSCGRARPRRQSKVIESSGRMTEVDLRHYRDAPASEDLRERWAGQKRRIWQEMCKVADARHPRNPTQAARLARKQFQLLFEEWPPQNWRYHPAGGAIDPDVALFVGAQIEAYRQRRQRGD